MDRGILNKATSSDDVPTPGYLFVDIAKMTFSVNVISKIVKYLSQRLRKDNPVVKKKTLLVIKHTCRKGDKAFRREIQTCGIVPEIKACLGYSGKPHPLKGDQPYRAVREAAKETLESVFDDSQDYSAGQGLVSGGSTLSNRIQGYGNNISSEPGNDRHQEQSSYFSGSGMNASASVSDSITSIANRVSATVQTYANEYSGRGTSGSNSYGGSGGRYEGQVGAGGKKYGGIGNPNFDDPRNKEPSFIDRVKTRIEKLNEQGASATISNIVSSSTGATDTYYNPRIDVSTNSGYGGPRYQQPSYQPNSSSSTHVETNRTRQRGQIGGVWGNSAPSPASDPRSPRMSGGTQEIKAGPVGAAVSDGSYEKSLLIELCGSHGVRLVPSKEKLKSFCSACETLDPEVIMPMLFNLLINGHVDCETDEKFDWKAQHKALCICEAFIQSDTCEQYVDFLDDNAEILERIIEGSRTKAVVKKKAKKVWRLLYDEDLEPSAELNVEVAQVSAPEEDLLGFADSEETQAASSLDYADNADSNGLHNQAGQASVQPSNTAVGGMFSNMNVKTKVPGVEDPNGEEKHDGLLNGFDSFVQKSTSDASNVTNQFERMGLESKNKKSSSKFSFMSSPPMPEKGKSNGFAFISSREGNGNENGKKANSLETLVQSNLNPSNGAMDIQATPASTNVMTPLKPTSTAQSPNGNGLSSETLHAMYQMRNQVYAQQPYGAPRMMYVQNHRPRSMYPQQQQSSVKPPPAVVQKQAKPDKFGDIVKASMAEM